MDPEVAQLCTHTRRGHRRHPNAEAAHRRAAGEIQAWCNANASNYKTKAEAAQACKFVLAATILGLILETIFEFFLWRILEHWFPSCSSMAAPAVGADD